MVSWRKNWWWCQLTTDDSVKNNRVCLCLCVCVCVWLSVCVWFTVATISRDRAPSCQSCSPSNLTKSHFEYLSICATSQSASWQWHNSWFMGSARTICIRTAALHCHSWHQGSHQRIGRCHWKCFPWEASTCPLCKNFLPPGILLKLCRAFISTCQSLSGHISSLLKIAPLTKYKHRFVKSLHWAG